MTIFQLNMNDIHDEAKYRPFIGNLSAVLGANEG